MFVEISVIFWANKIFLCILLEGDIVEGACGLTDGTNVGVLVSSQKTIIEMATHDLSKNNNKWFLIILHSMINFTRNFVYFFFCKIKNIVCRIDEFFGAVVGPAI